MAPTPSLDPEEDLERELHDGDERQQPRDVSQPAREERDGDDEAGEEHHH